MASDDYRAEYSRMPTSYDRYDHLDRILRSSEGDEIRRYDQDIASRRPSSTGIILTSRSSRISDIGPLVTLTDREIRRAVTIFESDSYDLGDPDYRPRPISANHGGLEVTDAALGSLHLLLAAYGRVLSLLTSKPLQALTSVITLGQGAGSIHLWRHRKKDPLEGISARQALEVLKAFDGNARRLMGNGEPDLEIEVQATEDQTETFTHPGLPEDADLIFPPDQVEVTMVSKSGDIIMRGRRLTYIRNYPDGTQDVIYVDG